MSGDGEKKDKRIKRLKGYLLYGAEKFKLPCCAMFSARIPEI